jgi:DNA-binding NtrC family response regulator
VVGDGILVKDLGSTNGSFFQGGRFESIRVGPGAELTIGKTELRIEAEGREREVLPPSPHDRFGDLLGDSLRMRHVFAVLERVAMTDACVLVHGETGTGKELVAEAIHRASPRGKKAFVVCDLASLPKTLIESELFGHIRGSFTGADRDREGAFEAADGGTLFLDEVGELELDVQPRLLRALERHQVKPVGATAYRTVDVRVVAATNRDLQAEVKAGRFREDLYHRLAVVSVKLPPLRDRPEDIPRLVTHFLGSVTKDPPQVPPSTMAALRAHEWPGNVRELRNVIERAVSLGAGAPMLDAALFGFEPPLPMAPPEGASAPPRVDTDVPFKEAKERLVDAWEREYVKQLLERAEGNISLAARQGGIDRVYLHRLLKKHGLES